MSTAIKHPVSDQLKPSFVNPGNPMLSLKRQSARMSKNTNDGFSWSDTGCTIYGYGNSGRQRVKTFCATPITSYATLWATAVTKVYNRQCVFDWWFTLVTDGWTGVSSALCMLSGAKNGWRLDDEVLTVYSSPILLVFAGYIWSSNSNGFPLSAGVK